jgi:hypothetical protein
MKVEGRRFHIAGSAHRTVQRELLEYGHAVIAHLADVLLEAGGSVTVGIGKEPRAIEDDLSSRSTIFDWTVLERVGAYLLRGGPVRTTHGPLVATVASSKTESQIPDDRRDLWEQLKGAGAVLLEFLDAGWSSGAVRRQRQARLGDVLIILSGGEGVEQLAQLHVQAGNPVIPLDLDLGASSEDGSGGAARLHKKALAAPAEFVRVMDPTRAGVLLSDLRTDGGRRPVGEVVSALIRLVEALAPPTVCYVRLLNPKLDGFNAVERFFRHVVDPTVKDLGYAPFEIGRHPTDYAWMNEEIFDRLHYSGAVVVDVTGLRNNCFMELGYALGRGLRVIVTAMKDTDPPFDSQMVPHHFWEDATDDAARQQAFKEFWAKHIDRPPLVQPRSTL